MDTLFSNVTVVTLDRHCTVLSCGYVGVENGKIVHVGRDKPEQAAKRTIDGRGKVLMPGLVNAHTHLPMTLLRGYADDCSLHHWLHDHIFPAEARLDARAVRAGAQLALAESLASGTVSVSDMYDHCGSIAACAAESGIKANLSRGVTCFSPAFDPLNHQGLRETKELADAWHGYDDGRILVDASIHAEYTSSPQVWESVAGLAQERGLGMHIHLAETKHEQDECVQRHGMTPAEAMDRAGVFQARTTAAHGVHLTDEDMQLLAARGVSVAHCPVSNLKLASGIARLSNMLKNGLNVALGTDGAASNNTLDIWEEMKTACLLAKNASGAPESFSSVQALALAVTGGVRAQGRQSECGQISVGFDADVILLDFGRPHLTPCQNPLSHLVYAAHGSDVVLTMVRGRILYEHGVFTTIDMERVASEVHLYAIPKIFGG